MAIFMIPFLLVGLFLLGLSGYQLLSLFNPKIRLTIIPGSPRLGDTLDVQWDFQGRTERILQLHIFLEGREEVTYRRGTSTVTDKSPFATYEIASVAGLANVNSGQTRLKLPLQSIPSFGSTNNSIIWAIHVHGDIPLWPDVKEEFPIQLRPAPTPPLATT